MAEQRYNSIYTGQQIDLAVTWLLRHINDQVFGGGVSAGTIPTPEYPTYWLASAGTYTCGSNTFVVPAGGVGIISYNGTGWTFMPVGGVELVNNLTSGGTTKALTAEQGKVLKAIIDNILPTIENMVESYDVTFLFQTQTITTEKFAELLDAINSNKYLVCDGFACIVNTAVTMNNTRIHIKAYTGVLLATYNIDLNENDATISGSTMRLQPHLVNGENIKTINQTSLLGSGNINVQPTLVSGQNIKTINNQSLLGNGNIVIQGGGGGIECVTYSDYAEMAADESQPNGTIAFESEEEKFYIFDQANGIWKLFTDESFIDVSWWFTDTLTTQDYSRMQSIIDTGRQLMHGSCPVIVTKNSNGEIELCTLRDTTLEYTSLDEFGQSSSGTISIPRTFKTINGSAITTSGNLSLAEPVSVVEVTGSTPTQELQPNTFYKFGSVTSLNVTLAAGATGMAAIYAFSFTAAQANPTITLPSSVIISDAPSIAQGDLVEFNIMDNKAICKVWS